MANIGNANPQQVQLIQEHYQRASQPLPLASLIPGEGIQVNDSLLDALQRGRKENQPIQLSETLYDAFQKYKREAAQTPGSTNKRLKSEIPEKVRVISTPPSPPSVSKGPHYRVPISLLQSGNGAAIAAAAISVNNNNNSVKMLGKENQPLQELDGMENHVVIVQQGNKEEQLQNVDVDGIDDVPDSDVIPVPPERNPTEPTPTEIIAATVIAKFSERWEDFTNGFQNDITDVIDDY